MGFKKAVLKDKIPKGKKLENTPVRKPRVIHT